MADPQRSADPPQSSGAWRGIRGRLFGGLLLILPILITLWTIAWLYLTLKQLVIDPLTQIVLWKVQGASADRELSAIFEHYVAPVVALLIALLLLYALGFVVHTRLRGAIDWVLLRLPVISAVYQSVRQVFQALERHQGQQRPQRVVLVAFPHPGMRAPAFVTATCRDVETQQTLLCVYVPTTPVPTSGYFLLVPAEEVTEANWTVEEALQAIISAGLTVPAEVRYFPQRAAAQMWASPGAGGASS